MKSDKALTRVQLELTQRIQTFFPDDIDPDILAKWNSCPKQELMQALRDTFGKKPSKRLLKRLGTITIPASEKFVPKNHFKVDTSPTAEVKISNIWGNFEKWFLPKEEEVPAAELAYHELTRGLASPHIIFELGGEEKAETSLSAIWELLKKQPHGRRGSLLLNGHANIFYIRDFVELLRAVCVCWGGDGWYLNAVPVDDPSEWGGVRRVFSRNS